MSRHTPGPWNWSDDECTRWGRKELSPCVITGTVEGLIDISDEDARLISAAPELLEALKKMLDEHYYQIGYDMTIDNPACVAAVAALAKATGDKE